MFSGGARRQGPRAGGKRGKGLIRHRRHYVTRLMVTVYLGMSDSVSRYEISLIC
jgi:hypothetical protein